MIKFFFVSTGRCGTKRIYEILSPKGRNLTVFHQMPISRIGNVIGNIMYSWGHNERVKTFFYNKIMNYCHSDSEVFICSDPLTSMLLPDKIVNDADTIIIHVLREKTAFAKSFFKITRKRKKSMLAHNLIPFWQPGLLIFENLLNKNITKKYEGIWDKKTEFFRKKYSKNPNYKEIFMDTLFQTGFLEETINQFCTRKISISKNELSIKSN